MDNDEKPESIKDDELIEVKISDSSESSQETPESPVPYPYRLSGTTNIGNNISHDNTISTIAPQSGYHSGTIIEVDPLNDLYNRANHISIYASHMATFYKFIDVLSRLLILILGVAITSIASHNYHDDGDNYTIAAGVLGAIVSCLEGCRTLFDISERGNIYKQTHNAARTITRKSVSLSRSNLVQGEIDRKIDQYHSKLDDLEMSIYNSKVVDLTSNSKIDKDSTSRSTSEAPSPNRSRFKSSASRYPLRGTTGGRSN